MKQVQILIAGGGPVGMTLARDLARRGITCMLVERNLTTTRHPKMDITNVRSMELFRRLSLVDELRAVGVPESSNFDISWITSLSGHELHRFRYPSVTEWRRMIRDVNDGSMPAEPPMRVSQVEIEPVLQRSIQAEASIEARWGVAFDHFSQNAQGVTATLRTADDKTEQVRCRYLVGCDGGASRVRSCLGIRLEGQSRVAQRFVPSTLPQMAAKLDMKAWPAPLVRMFLGQMTPAVALAAAADPNAAKQALHVCEAHFWSGEWALRRGSKDEALRLFRLAPSECPKTFSEWASAKGEIKTLGAKP